MYIEHTHIHTNRQWWPPMMQGHMYFVNQRPMMMTTWPKWGNTRVKKNSSLKTTNDGDRQNIDLISSSMMIMISNHHYYWKRHENENQIFWHKMWFQVFNDHVGSSHLIFFVVWLSFEILDIKAAHTRLHEMWMFFFYLKKFKIQLKMFRIWIFFL